jgi:hypothetical protein
MSHTAKPAPAGRRSRAGGALVIAGYAAAVYLIAAAVLGYALGFFIGAGVPKGIDQGPHAPWPLAAAADLALLLVFAVQHTVMARPWFKRRLTRVVPPPAERATFVLGAALALALPATPRRRSPSRLHPGGHLVRGARPGALSRRDLHRLSGQRARADPGPAAPGAVMNAGQAARAG